MASGRISARGVGNRAEIRPAEKFSNGVFYNYLNEL